MSLVAFLLGVAVGSFLNVVITQLPRKEPLISRPLCPACGSPIRWYHNIPILSFLWLRGRCRTCGGPFGWRYPAVEAVTATLFALSASHFGLTPALFPALFLLAALVAAAAIDLEHQLIPDWITLSGIAAGLLASLVTRRLSWIDTMLGGLVGAGIFLLIILLSGGRMGGGDMKLAAMIGTFLGWKLTLLAIFLGVLLGGLVAGTLLAARRRKRGDSLPFGPFLAFGATVSLFWGDGLLRWYLRGFR